MEKPETPRLFISYAHIDGADLALRLQMDLTAKGFDTWLDTQRLKPGASWTVEIEKIIDDASTVLAILTPGSYVSSICRAEQLRSLRKNKRLIPLLGHPSSTSISPGWRQSPRSPATTWTAPTP